MPLGQIHETDNGTFYECSSCGFEHTSDYSAMDCCTFECQYCGNYYDTEGEVERCCYWACENCGARYSDEDQAYDCCYDEYEDDRSQYFSADYPPGIEDVDVEHIVYVPAIEGRPIRACSIEQELSSGGAAVARLLSNIGISRESEILNYTADTGAPNYAIVKHDGSLGQGGGEVLYSRFDLGNIRNARRFSKALACIDEMQREGIVHIGMDAGTHIHISALDEENRPFGPAQMQALYEIFSFSEDVIFRMASAGWPQHRGLNYTRQMPKFNIEDKEGITPSKIAKQAQRERYFSLNFRRLLNAVQSCGCGACIVGDWAGCDCGVLSRGTIEWRVFNAVTDPKTLHSWVLLAQGMTAAAFTHPLHTLMPHEFNAIDSALHPWIFGWILWNCPFQDSERQLLLDTARVSPGLHLPWEDIDVFHSRWDDMDVPEEEVRAWDGQFPNCSCPDCVELRAQNDDELNLAPATPEFHQAGVNFQRWFDRYAEQMRNMQPPTINWASTNTTITPDAYETIEVDIPSFISERGTFDDVDIDEDTPF